jgi:hypothetical protein
VSGSGGRAPAASLEGAHPALRPDVELVAVGDERFLLDRVAARVHALNDTAAAVVTELDGTASLDAVARRLAATYGVPADRVSADLSAVIAQLRAEQLLVGGRPAPPGGERVPGIPPSSSALGPLAERLLDAAPWPHRLGPYRALDASFGVVLDDDDLAAYLARVLAPLALGAAAPAPPARTYRISSPARRAGRWRVWIDSSRIVAVKTPAQVAEHLLWHVNRSAVSGTDRPVFHAAAAVAPGGAVLLPAASNAGKSTLVAGLVASGLGYLSDEAIAVDLPDRLLPFPKAISLDRGSWALFPAVPQAPEDETFELHRRHVPAERFSPGAAAATTPVRWIVCPRYVPDAPVQVEQVPPGDVFPTLLEQCFHLGAAPDAARQVATLVESCETWRVVAGDLADAVAAVRSIVGA